MDRTTANFPAYSAPGIARTIRDAFAEVAALLFGSAPFQPRKSLELEVRELIEPQLAILTHKRMRYLTPDVSGAIRSDRWAAELHGFIERSLFWPAPASGEAHGNADRRHLAHLVDRIVAGEQEKAAAEGALLPATSRFDSYWAD
jgi:hypothetical protein